jgi:transglutaminase-like putative cysteine protease
MHKIPRQFIGVVLASMMLTGCSSMERAANDLALGFTEAITGTAGGNVTETYEDSSFVAFEKVSEAYLRHDNVGFTNYGVMCSWWQHFNYYHNDMELLSTINYDTISYKGQTCYKVKECGNTTSRNVQSLLDEITAGIARSDTKSAVESTLSQIGDFLDYDESVTIPYSLESVVANRKGICTAYAILASRALQKAGYNAQVVRGTTDYDTNQSMKHAWIRVEDKERSTEDEVVYIYADPTLYDQAESEAEKAVYANIGEDIYESHYHEKEDVAYDEKGFVEVY